MKKLFFIAVALLIFFSCKEKSPVEPEGPARSKDGTTVQKEVVFLSSNTYSKFNQATNKAIFISGRNDEIKNLKRGNIIFGPKNNIFPNGFLREVIRTDNDHIYTKTAKLDQLFQKGKIELEFSIPMSIPKSLVLPKGVIMKVTETELYYDFNKLVYSSNEGEIKFYGDLYLIGFLNTGLDFSPFKLEVSSELIGGINIGASSSFTKSVYKEIPILKDIPLMHATVQTPIGIPVEGTVYLDVIAIINGVATQNSVLEVKNVANLVFEFTTDKNGQKTNKLFTNVFTLQKSTFELTGKVKGSIEVKLSLHLYELLGPSVAIIPYSEFDLDISRNPQYEVWAGAEAKIGIDMGKFLTKFVKDYSFSVLNEKKLIASGGEVPQKYSPLAKFNIPGEVNINEWFTIDASGSYDPDGGELKYRWDLNGDGNWDSSYDIINTFTYSYESSGNYNIKLQVKDDEGETDQTIKSITVIGDQSNNPPTAILKVTPRTGTISTTFSFDARDSYDDETANTNMNYKFKIDNEPWGNYMYSYPIKNCNFSTTGYHTVMVKVKDEGGLTDEASKTVYVSEKTGDEETYYLSFNILCTDGTTHYPADLYIKILDAQTKQVESEGRTDEDGWYTSTYEYKETDEIIVSFWSNDGSNSFEGPTIISPSIYYQFYVTETSDFKTNIPDGYDTHIVTDACGELNPGLGKISNKKILFKILPKTN